MSIRKGEILGYFREHGLDPSICHRFDGTLELTWRVDDNGDRYVRLTTSVHSSDCAVVYRNFRVVEAVVLNDLKQMFEWVRIRLLLMDTRRVFTPDLPAAG